MKLPVLLRIVQYVIPALIAGIVAIYSSYKSSEPKFQRSGAGYEKLAGSVNDMAARMEQMQRDLAQLQGHVELVDKIILDLAKQKAAPAAIPTLATAPLHGAGETRPVLRPLSRPLVPLIPDGQVQSLLRQKSMKPSQMFGVQRVPSKFEHLPEQVSAK
jgi:hypothetical protein